MAEHVILLHGLARTANSLLLLEKRLELEGFVTINETYPSREKSLPDLIETVIPPLLARCQDAERVHFVTHSMGGIILRGFLADHSVHNLGRVVMLAPPNKGSELVSRMKDLPGFETVNGPASAQLGADLDSIPNTIQDREAEIGIIAGDLALNPIYGAMIGEPNDGKVSVEATKLRVMTDHIVLPVSHTFMMNSAEVSRQTIGFLRTGQFARPTETATAGAGDGTGAHAARRPAGFRLPAAARKWVWGGHGTPETTIITPALGAEVSGIDLNHVGEQQIDVLYDALIQRQVIVLRGQTLTPEAHLRLAQAFGEVEPPHPIYPHAEGFPNIVVLANDAANPPDTDGWHTDVTFKPSPPFASLLVARELPPAGGDTLWMSGSAAYDALPADMKTMLDGMVAVHDMGDFRNNFAVQPEPAARLVEAHQRIGSAIHPVVGTHPVTGRRFLFVNEGFTQHVVGLRASESNDLLHWLYRHMNQPEFQMRLRWEEGTVVMWDNRCTQHYATADYLPHRRVMHRITIASDRRAPVA